MSNLKLAEFTTYESAQRYLSGAVERFAGYKTWVRRNVDGSISVRHHQTDIIVYHPDGSITLHNGGWHTPTTSNRLHKLTPRSVRVGIKQYEMYYSLESEGHERHPLIGPVTLSAEEIAS